MKPKTEAFHVLIRGPVSSEMPIEAFFKLWQDVWHSMQEIRVMSLFKVDLLYALVCESAALKSDSAAKSHMRRGIEEYFACEEDIRLTATGQRLKTIQAVDQINATYEFVQKYHLTFIAKR